MAAHPEPVNPVLEIPPGARQPHLQHSSQVLLDCLGLDLPLRLAEAPQGQAPRLILPTGVVVAEAELEQVFAATTLQQELIAGRCDKMGRVDENAISWDTSRPWVDQKAAEIARRLQGGPCLQFRKEPFRVIISHDIDWTGGIEPFSLAKSLLSMLGLRRNSWLPWRTAVSAGALAENIRRLLRFELANQIGAYFFMLSGPYRLGRYASRYDAAWPQARLILRSIQEAGMNLGLHGSYHASDRNSYRAEKERLEEVAGTPVTCHRNHYLRFDRRRFWSQLESAEIQYDFSLGFGSRMGFRAGLARPHRTFDLAGGRPSAVISVPLLYMDTLLFDSPPPVLLDRLRAALKEVKDVHGCVCLLFHPEWFLVREDFWRLFQQVVAMCRELGADLSGVLPPKPAMVAGKPRFQGSAQE